VPSPTDQRVGVVFVPGHPRQHGPVVSRPQTYTLVLTAPLEEMLTIVGAFRAQ
jgi:hypothetical protein